MSAHHVGDATATKPLPALKRNIGAPTVASHPHQEIVKQLLTNAAPRPAVQTARATWTALTLFSLVIVARAVGIVGSAVFPVITMGGVLCAFVGLRRHRPSLRWPWWAMIATGILWTIAGVARELTQATGDFTTDRSLIPDAFALPGYVLFGLALFGLLRSRRLDNEKGALLDGIIFGSGALLMVHELLIEPTLGLQETWLVARIAVAIYPAVSVGLIILAARLAFGVGDRSVAFRLLLVGTASLLIGDVVFAIGEVHEHFGSTGLLELPYLLVPACIGSAVLHPSIALLGRRTASEARKLGSGRLAIVAGALLTPIALTARQDLPAGRIVTTVLAVVLVSTAIVRLAGAIRQQSESEMRLVHQATHDELTGLPSRALVIEHTDNLLVKSQTDGHAVALMFVDLDQLKLVNDSMGHVVGDQLLVEAARRIAACVRPDDFVGRISGDEFIVVGFGLDSLNAQALAERIRNALGEGFDLDVGEVFISASIGVTIGNGASHVQASTLIQEADTAMYRSKDAGRNTVTMFDASMRERVARRVDLERRLRQALQERHLAAYYQPLVALPSGRVNGFEALARWSDGGQMISPAEFIPIAEESGLIVPLGAFMLDEACKQIATWRLMIPDGERLHMSVNLSPRQVRESDIVDTVAETLERYNLPGEALWLEITENLMMEDSVATAGVMAGLRALGVRLTVDDFGTGFSSLSYLKRFPVSRVKIDRAFISGLCEHESDSSLVLAIVAMASALGLEPVAEGVETAEQAQRLFELGCREAQGYLFERAVPAEAVPRMLQRLGVASGDGTTPPRRCATARGRI